MSTGGGSGLNCGGKFGAVAHFAHHRDGETAGANGISDRGAADRALQSAGDDGYFSRTACRTTGDSISDINEELTDTCFF